MIVLFTVGLSIPLKKVPGSDLLLAMGADEVLWVPRLSHGGHDLGKEAERGSGPWPATEHTPLGGGPGEPISSHLRLPPLLPFPLYHLSSDGLLAGPADPFGNRGDPQFVQVRLQAPQHTIQLAPRLRGAPRGRAAPRLPLGHKLQRQGERRSGLQAWGRGLAAPRHRGLFSLLDRGAVGGKQYNVVQGPQSPEPRGGSDIHEISWESEGLAAPHWPTKAQKTGKQDPRPPCLGTDPSLVLPFGTALPVARRPAGRPRFSICHLFQALDLG